MLSYSGAGQGDRGRTLMAVFTQPEERPKTSALITGLAGLQAGVLGGLAGLSYVMLDGFLRGNGPWPFPNLLSTAIYSRGGSALVFTWATMSGIALQLVLAGLLGLLASGLLVQYLNRPRFCRVIGLLVGLSWYYVTVRLLWPDLNLDVIRYQPPSGAILGYVILGLVLGLYPKFFYYLKPAEPAGKDESFP